MSPYKLLQEIYYLDKWKILISCILLNLTSRKQVDKIREEFFKILDSPESVKEEDYQKMILLLTPLGFKDKRTSTIIRFSKEFLDKNWTRPIELYGIGKYGQDSYDIFILNKFISNPSDKVLKTYIQWKTQKLV